MIGSSGASLDQDIALHDRRPIYNALLNNLPGMVYQCQNDSCWTMEFVSNGCFDLTGYTPDDLLLNRVISYNELIHPDDRELGWLTVQSALEKRKIFELIYRIRTRSGQEKWVREVGCGIFDPHGSISCLEGFITDISDRKLAEMRIQRQTSRFQALRAIDDTISASSDLSYTLGVLLEQIVSQLNVDAADILLYRPETLSLEYGASRGFQANALQFTCQRLGEEYAGEVALTRKTIHIPDLAAGPGRLRQLVQHPEENFKVYYGVPLLAKGEVKGVLEVFQRIPQGVDEEWFDFLEASAGQAAIAIDNAVLFEDLQRSNVELSVAYDATLEGWAKALELRDRETEGHAYRVIEKTVRLAQALGINGEPLQDIRRGALLHDIGKMGIPDSILLKPGPLTLAEWEIMRKHPVYAYEMLRSIEYLRPALDIPYCHHEKWDGTGYPRGLKGNEIPIAARIFAVVDVWDALTSNRPYRVAWSEKEAREYIRAETGRHFDPPVVQAFLSL